MVYASFKTTHCCDQYLNRCTCPSLGIIQSKVFLFALCATVSTRHGVFRLPVGANSESKQKENMTMNINIKHKHSGHVIIIEGHAFKANDRGQWDLTDIWRTLKLPKGKSPGQWAKRKEAERYAEMQKLNLSHGSGAWATKQATIRYAAWVSPEFEDMVYDAFEAILEMPEVAALVADKMASLGNDHGANILKRMTFNDKCDWKALKAPHKNTQRGLIAAVKRGHLTLRQARDLGLRAVPELGLRLS